MTDKMNVQMKDRAYYESEGMRYMELGEDGKARTAFLTAEEMGSERAKTFLAYLDMNVSDADFQKSEREEEVFDYDLQPLYAANGTTTGAKVYDKMLPLREIIRIVLNRASYRYRVPCSSMLMPPGISV